MSGEFCYIFHMQNSLDLKMYKVPEHFSDEAKAFFDEINEDFQSAMNKANDDFREQVAFLKRQYLIAIKRLRPGSIDPKSEFFLDNFFPSNRFPIFLTVFKRHLSVASVQIFV